MRSQSLCPSVCLLACLFVCLFVLRFVRQTKSLTNHFKRASTCLLHLAVAYSLGHLFIAGFQLGPSVIGSASQPAGHLSGPNEPNWSATRTKCEATPALLTRHSRRAICASDPYRFSVRPQGRSSFGPNARANKGKFARATAASAGGRHAPPPSPLCSAHPAS